MKKIIAAFLAGTCIATMAGIQVFADADVKYTIDFAKDYVFDDDGKKLEEKKKDSEFAPTDDIWIPMDNLSDGAKLYADVPVKNFANALSDDDLFKKKFDKGNDDTKIISKISFEQKDVVAGGSRENAIHVELKNDYTDKDYKISPEITFTAKKNMTADGKETDDEAQVKILKGDKFMVTFTAHVSNKSETTDDRDFDAGEDGIIVKPVKDEDNTVTWQNENDDIAKLEFTGDSDVDKYFPKLSTKWSDSDYAENFEGQDAYIFDFVGHPTISATSRPLLTIYNPFYDRDEDELTVPSENVVIYEVVDGALVEVTDKFTAGQNEDGDEVFTIKTRTLGTYIFAEAPASAPTDEIEEPVPVIEDETKQNPGTGRF